MATIDSLQVVRDSLTHAACGLALLLATALVSQAVAADPLRTTTRTPPADSCYEGNLADVLELVARAVKLIEDEGAQAAFPRITDRGGGFVRGDLYVFVLDPEGRVVANGAAPESVGASALAARDEDGRYFIREILQRAFRVGDGWIRYHWFSPCNGKWIDKQVYFRRVGRYVVCAGFYNTLAI